MTATHSSAPAHISEYVTAMIGDQLFGFPVSRIQDVFVADRLTSVPLSSPDIAGVLNLRGRIVTAIDIRIRLGLPDPIGKSSQPMAIGVDLEGEIYGLLIDRIGEVIKLDVNHLKAPPANLPPMLAKMATGIHQLEQQLLIILDIDRLLERSSDFLAA